MITLIYASTIGNTEATMQHISQTLEKNSIPTQLIRVETATPDILEKNDTFILATSTWGHGDINPLWNKLLTTMQTTNMKNKKSAFVGLGDYRYEPVYFCRGVDILKEAFIKAGGEAVNMTLKINGDPYQHFDKLVKVWTSELITLWK